MSKNRPTYQELESRLAAAEPIVEALKHHEVDAVVGKGKIALLLLQKVEEALVGSEAGFRALFDLSGVGMAQADTPALRFTRVNRKFCEIAGYSGEELLERTYLELTHPRDRRRDMKALARVLRGKADSWSIEKRCIRKDASIIWVGVNGAALRGADGQVVRILAMITDLTAGKQAEQERRAAEEELKKRVRELTAELAQGKRAPMRLKKAGVKKARRADRSKSPDKPRPTQR